MSIAVSIKSTNSQKIYKVNVNLNLELSTNGLINVTVISDGFNGTYWNEGWSEIPEIAADGFGNIHVVWMDNSKGVWKNDINDNEVFYANYSVLTNQWSNITVISDGYNDVWGWNDDTCYSPKIVADNSGNLHVIWEGYSSGIWKDSMDDAEIMYVNYSIVTGQWSNVTILSDGWNNVWGWNN
ncbi:MAG: hypothetical protein ACFFE4_11290, partial [Candidatus Thorarchaeota archaeon]